MKTLTPLEVSLLALIAQHQGRSYLTREKLEEMKQSMREPVRHLADRLYEGDTSHPVVKGLLAWADACVAWVQEQHRQRRLPKR